MANTNQEHEYFIRIAPEGQMRIRTIGMYIDTTGTSDMLSGIPLTDAYAQENIADYAPPATMPPVIFSNANEGVLPQGDIQTQSAHSMPFTLDDRVSKRVEEFHRNHPGVDLSPVINERIDDLLDACESAEVS